MFQWLLRKINRRCPICRVRIEGEGVRRGLRLFCSPAHREKYVEEQQIRMRALGRMGNDRGGGCCC